jgi:hypothetical protein
LHEPACGGYGCGLSGDSTAFLSKMNWTTWSATEAVGTGTYKIDDCNPNCAGGTVYPVATTVTLSQPVKVCSSSGTRWYWSRASFQYPQGLPKALQGQNAPANPWTFSSVVSAAQASCGTDPAAVRSAPTEPQRWTIGVARATAMDHRCGYPGVRLRAFRGRSSMIMGQNWRYLPRTAHDHESGASCGRAPGAG